MQNINLKFKFLNENAKLPSFGSDFAAGMDICSCEDLIILPQTSRIVKTGLAISWEGVDAQNYYLRIAPRSGLAVKNGIFVNAGVIDYDYRGEIGIVLYNSKNEDFVVKKGDRIAQMIMEKIMRPKIFQVEELDNTTRGIGGFGSTGV
jgi:dUTP pyrophosphatase